MSDWTEKDSAVFRDIAAVAVPRRTEMLAAVLASIPYGAAEAFKVVDIGAGEGRLDAALLESFPRATLLALDGSESMRALAAHRLERFGTRAKVRPFNLSTLDWWDLMHGADVIVSSLCLHHLNDAKKQYLFRAVADRISARGFAAKLAALRPGSASRLGTLSKPVESARCQPGPRACERSGRALLTWANGSSCSLQLARHSEAPPVKVVSTST